MNGILGKTLTKRLILLPTLAASYYDDPSLLFDVLPGSSVGATVAVDSVSREIDITPQNGVFEAFFVRVIVTDGIADDTEIFRVTVSAAGGDGMIPPTGGDTSGEGPELDSDGDGVPDEQEEEDGSDPYDSR